MKTGIDLLSHFDRLKTSVDLLSRVDSRKPTSKTGCENCTAEKVSERRID
jgi:hypothetical protein